jgi:hypothetical protein
VERAILANRLATTIVDIDLQLYKGSIYKLRWGSPGGLDQSIPCYRTAAALVEDAPWPEELRKVADGLADRVRAYVAVLEAKDVTTASAQHSLMMSDFEVLRGAVRGWPEAEKADTGSG